MRSPTQTLFPAPTYNVDRGRPAQADTAFIQPCRGPGRQRRAPGAAPAHLPGRCRDVSSRQGHSARGSAARRGGHHPRRAAEYPPRVSAGGMALAFATATPGREKALPRVRVDGLREVAVEAGLPRSLDVSRLSIAGDGDQADGALRGL